MILIVYCNDIKILRFFTRRMYYRIENHRFFKLKNTRTDLLKHHYIDKEEILKSNQQNN